MIRQVIREGVELDRRHHDIPDAVIGCAMRVHTALGVGYLEQTYEEALAIELKHQGIPHQRQYTYAVQYRGHKVGEGRLDLLIADEIVVELKAVERLAPIHTAQVLAHLTALQLPAGIIINFNVPHLRKGLKRVTHPSLYQA